MKNFPMWRLARVTQCTELTQEVGLKLGWAVAVDFSISLSNQNIIF